MTDTTFRTPTVASEPVGKISNEAAKTVTDVEVPYLDYEREHAHPYTVDHFQLGDSWKDPSGGFYNEISTIETYLSGKIRSGEIENSLTAIREVMKKAEKTLNIPKEERQVVKIETLAAYMKFLMESDTIKGNSRKYANS